MKVKDSTNTPPTKWPTDRGGPDNVKGDYEGATKPPINPSAQLVSSPDTFSTSTSPLVNLSGDSK